jgi:hypothetical protein
MNAKVTGPQTDGADVIHLENSLSISIQFLRISIKLMKRGQREMKRIRKDVPREECKEAECVSVE